MTWLHLAAAGAFVFALGASVGSFLNVCIWRLPRGMSVIRPASRCPHCGGAIAPRDNVPLLGWLRLLGRCRLCRGPISARYPLVEAATGALFVLAAAGPIAGGADPLEQGLGGFLALTAYHFGQVAFLVTAGMVTYDELRGETPRRPARGFPGATAAGAIVAVVLAGLGLVMGDLVGSAGNVLLLGVALARLVHEIPAVRPLS